MRRRKSYNIIILFALTFFLSVGYAVVNSVSLSVTGSASAGTTEINTFFTGETITTKTSSATVTPTVTSGSKSASLTIENMSLNETVKVEYQIANEEKDIGALVTVDSITNSNPTYYDVTASIKYAAVMCESSSTSEDYNTLILTVKLKKTPINASDEKTNIGVSINATPAPEPNACPT